MSAFAQPAKRRVIPRWRDSLSTVAIGELEPAILLAGPVPPSHDFLTEKIADWKENKTIGTAADLVGAAYVLGREDEVIDATRFLLENENTSPTPAIQLAKRILRVNEGAAPEIKTIESSELNLDQYHAVIRRLRWRLRNEPRNALLRVDLARYYTILALGEKAEHQMEIALRLAPDNRFTLRSAARLFVHLDKPDNAHYILKHAKATKLDPWLAAAEIAVATVAGRTSKLVNAGKKLLITESIAPLHKAELASAIGTLELDAGNNKQSKKLFRLALKDPTDNAIAQVEWASRQLGDPSLIQGHLDAPRSYEARALEYYLSAKWGEALKESWNWLNDEPFSTRPAMLGSFVSSVGLEDYEATNRIARAGLKANPNDQIIRNNLTFALASAGRIQEAITEYNLMDKKYFTDTSTILWIATGGLIKFRLQQHSEGRELYYRAMELAERKQNQHLKAMAAAFLAREEILAGTNNWNKALDVANNLAKKEKDKSVQYVIEKIRKLQLSKHPDLYRA